MANELTLKMETPIEELVPAMIAWNNKELKENALIALESYRGITYTEAQIGDAKKDKAKLNAFVKALNDERIRISKVYHEPYEKFKKEVDEVIELVKEVSTEIDTQVKAYDEARKERKEELIKEVFRNAVGEFDGVLKYETVRQEKWLNKSVAITAVRADIVKAVEDAKRAMAAIEALHSPDEDFLKAYYFRTLNLGDALLEHERLKQERSNIASMKAEEIGQTPYGVEITEEPTMELSFRVEGTVDQLKALKHFMQSNNIKYFKI